MIKIPDASPATASIAGLISGVLVSLIMLSHRVLGEGVLSGLIFLLLGGYLSVAFRRICRWVWPVDEAPRLGPSTTLVFAGLPVWHLFVSRGYSF